MPDASTQWKISGPVALRPGRWTSLSAGIVLAAGLLLPPAALIAQASAPSVSPQPAAASAPAAQKRLPDPPASQIPVIIQKFASHEKLFRQLLAHSYTYTETIKVETLDGDGHATGTYEQVDDITYDSDDGHREIVCTYCPQSTLTEVSVTEEDINDFFNMDMYTVDVDDLPQYNVTYQGHVPLDHLTTYVFSISPKTIEKGHRYFQGKVWVDDHGLQIVKSDGKAVPDEYDKHGHPTNQFLPFETWRQMVDGKYWFPVFTRTNSKLWTETGDIPIRMIIHFRNYRQFRGTARILSTQELPQSQQQTPAQPPKPAAPNRTPPPQP